ncbi:AAA family ATPase [Pararhodobacter oceanensis]|uniref:AAA family ATPase n=1 Tax=Pararhodobacter oceanensis TaxID=2172121 RepID=UPI003A8CFA5C
MKLRSITMTDVRQFSRPVHVGDIRDGLNVLSAPNEAGKSTLFDAIHALFFIPHRSSKIAPLRPDIGGNPQITIEIELPDGMHRLTKVWGRGKLAEVARDGRLIAKGDEAEAFISGLTLPADEGGPAGLLWVRQGVTALDEGSNKELKAAYQARRDLMSSVTGEFEALTGGKRMDRALTKAQADLDALVTQRGAKAGGAYDAALKNVAQLSVEHDALSARAQLLQEALKTRRAQRQMLRDLTDPAEVEARNTRLTEASAAFEAATRHADALRVAQAEFSRAETAQSDAAQQLSRHQKTAAAVAKMQEDLAAAQPRADAAQAAVTAAKSALTDARNETELARDARRTADQRLQTALRAAARTAQLQRHQTLVGTVAEATELVAKLPGLRHAAQEGPDAKTAQMIDAAEQDLRVAQHLAAAAAPHIEVRYASADAPRVTLEGRVIDAAVSLAVQGVTTLNLPGIGDLQVTPGEGQDAPEQLAQAQRKLADLLNASQMPSASAARAAARDRQQAETELQAVLAHLKRLAPNGMDALKSEAETLMSGIPEPSGIDPDTAQTDVNIAAQAYDKAQIKLETARVHLNASEQAHLRATLAQDNLSERLTEAKTVLDELPDIQLLRENCEAAQHALDLAQQALANLSNNAPNLDAARTARDRAADVVRNAEAEIAKLNVAIARSDATIETQAGDGVEEDLVEVSEQLTSARETVALFEQEIAVLRCLIAALVTAQSAARDRYFAPVLAELRPMLRLLWPDAELRFDGDSLLPSALIRDGQEDPIGTLSGGTREQIALLVRLAFARLLAGQGKHAPVILDDALVYTDDDRIEQMFNALHGQSGDLQILVFSCRNRALRALGGHMLSLAPGAPGEG